MSRARAFCLLRASAAAAAAAFASRRIHGDASGAFSEPASASTPPDPAGLDAPVAAAYPKTAANKSTAQWRVYTDVARDLSSRGDLEAAGVYLRRALHEAIAGFGEDDPHVAAARNNLAELYRLQRRFDEAEKLYAVAAAALEKHYGPSHPAAGAATHNLAGCKLSRGDYAGAYRAYASAALKKKKALGAHHPDYAATLFHMAEAKRAGGEYAAAVTLLEESVRVLDASGQGESAVACRRMERLAQTQGDLNGDHVAAEATRRRVLEAREHAAKVAGAFSRKRPKPKKKTNQTRNPEKNQNPDWGSWAPRRRRRTAAPSRRRRRRTPRLSPNSADGTKPSRRRREPSNYTRRAF
jgi:tetratricopeptide (TPR) repeat protein